MLCAVSMNKADVNLYDTDKLSLSRIDLKDALKCLVRTNFKGVAGLRLADESQMEDVLSESYDKVIGVSERDAKYPERFPANSILMSCDNMRPYFERDTLQLNREDFKMFFKSGVVLLIWSKGYLYEIYEKDNKVLMNGQETSWGYMPRGIGYVVEEKDGSYSLYLRNKWLNIDGKHIRYCINHDVMYGKQAEAKRFIQEYKKFR